VSLPVAVDEQRLAARGGSPRGATEGADPFLHVVDRARRLGDPEETALAVRGGESITRRVPTSHSTSVALKTAVRPSEG
jgi:hypothetical protein